MKIKSGIVLMISGAVLVASALSLASYNVYTDYDAKNKSYEVLQVIEEKIENEQVKNNGIVVDFESNHYVENTEMESVLIDGKRYIGVLDIPVLGLKLPIMEEWSYPNLKISPCRYKGSIKENNLVLAAHNYSSHFGNIKNLMSDDRVYFSDVNGVVYEFKVVNIEKLNGSDTVKMENGEWDLTLFTCNFDGTKRVTVRLSYV